ncbi:MAG: Poly (ADP-ribose) glycohydrolase [Planctomycetaceae bacterium]|nr:Poly (ADP-ribose) glycohydrolase [Planctomycetaceae bacterium]
MRDPMLAPFCRVEFNAQELMAADPPIWRDANKQLVASISCPPRARHAGTIGFTRWRPRPLKDPFNSADFRTQIEPRPGFFAYQPVTSPQTTVAWYLNFADPQLFGYYSGRLFAQDETQVTEHPALGAVREALSKSDIAPLTVENKLPTPALVTGVERRCAVATEPNAAANRPSGLYGNRFSSAPEEAVRKATRAIVPPTISNILAIAALPDNSGEYTRDQILYTLQTAVTGFSAAGIESERLQPAVTEIQIHTGHWGCGAFGGNRVLMALLQILAAKLIDVNKLVFYYGDASGLAPVQEAIQLLDKLLLTSNSLSGLLSEIVNQRFRWGVGDGN